MYGYGFLSWGFTDRREILYGSSTASQTGLLLFWGIAPEMAEFWASTGAIWWDMLLAEALVVDCSTSTPLYQIEPSADSAVQTVNRRRSSVSGRSSTVLEQAS